MSLRSAPDAGHGSIITKLQEQQIMSSEGDIVLDGVDFGYRDDKIVLHDVRCMRSQDRRLHLLVLPGAVRQRSLIFEPFL